MKFLPNADRLFVLPQIIEKVLPVEETEDRRRTVQTGKVLAVGPGIPINGNPQPLTSKEGQIVAFLDTAGCELEIDGTKYVILFERDLLGAFADDEGKAIIESAELSQPA